MLTGCQQASRHELPFYSTTTGAKNENPADWRGFAVLDAIKVSADRRAGRHRVGRLGRPDAGRPDPAAGSAGRASAGRRPAADRASADRPGHLGAADYSGSAATFGSP